MDIKWYSKKFWLFFKKIIFYLLLNMVLWFVLNVKYKNKVYNLLLVFKLYDFEKWENFEENKKLFWGNFFDKSLYDVIWFFELFLILSFI